MSGFPKPPKIGSASTMPSPMQSMNNRAQTQAPDPFPTPTGNTRLTDDETVAMMQKYLLPHQYGDAKLLQFIMAYLESRSTSQAAKEALVDYSVGYRWRQTAEVHACIEALTAKAVMKFGYDASEVIERVKEISALDPIEFENPDGSFKTNMSQIRPEARRAIKKFKAKNLYGEDLNGMRVVIGQIIEVECWDKIKAHELLGREKNIMKETKRVEHDVTKNMASVLLESSKRADDRAALMSRDVIEIQGGSSEDGTKGSSDTETRRDASAFPEPERGSAGDGSAAE